MRAWKRQTRYQNNIPAATPTFHVPKNVHMREKSLMPEAATVAVWYSSTEQDDRCTRATSAANEQKSDSSNRTTQNTCYHCFHSARENIELLSSEMRATHGDRRNNRVYSPISTMYTGFWLLPHSDPSLRKRPRPRQAKAWPGKQDEKIQGRAICPNNKNLRCARGLKLK